ncbi:MAG: HAD family hydrolase [Candidatus Brocadiia bacterium]
MADPQAQLKAFEPQHDFLVCIDSDGCTFDTMEVKHKFCFVVAVLHAYGLAALARILRDVWDFVNLNGTTRGCNRWLALRDTFQYLIELSPYERFQPFLEAHLDVIREFIQAADEREDVHLSNQGLLLFAGEKLDTPPAELLARCVVADPVAVATSPMGREVTDAPTDPQSCLVRLIYWTHLVNALVALRVRDVPPFPHVCESLEKLAPKADIICVSATPFEALTREWEEHDIARYAAIICGQEQGKKAEHIGLACGGKLDGKGSVAEIGQRYPQGHVLMVGDAPGDLKAARANQALFFPVNPGHEEQSWERFFKEAIDKFLAEDYAGDYETKLIHDFQAHLPESPPWERT